LLGVNDMTVQVVSSSQKLCATSSESSVGNATVIRFAADPAQSVLHLSSPRQ
jgi:hypothetical protein